MIENHREEIDISTHVGMDLDVSRGLSLGISLSVATSSLMSHLIWNLEGSPRDQVGSWEYVSTQLLIIKELLPYCERLNIQ
eukprot:1347606-Amorphochlora_amoeboformis.AAC.2